MKKTILKRSVASTLSFLMAFSSAVPSSVVYAEESGIESEIAKDYVATLSQTQNGTASFVTDGNKTQDPATHAQGDKVEVAVEPEEGFNAAKIEVKNTDGTVVASLEDGKVTANDEGNYTFEMPASNRMLFQYFMCSPAGCKGLCKYKKQIERDEEIAEELQDGNKSDRGAESQDS